MSAAAAPVEAAAGLPRCFLTVGTVEMEHPAVDESASDPLLQLEALSVLRLARAEPGVVRARRVLLAPRLPAAPEVQAFLPLVALVVLDCPALAAAAAAAAARVGLPRSESEPLAPSWPMFAVAAAAVAVKAPGRPLPVRMAETPPTLARAQAGLVEMRSLMVATEVSAELPPLCPT